MAIFDVNAGANTYTMDTPRLGTLNMVAFTGTWASSTAYQIYGNLSWGSGNTLSASNAITFMGRGSQTIAHNAKTYLGTYTLQSIGGTYTQQDKTTCNILNFTAGTWTANGNTVQAAIFETSTINATYPAVVNMGSGQWIIVNGVSGQTAWGFGTTTGLTLNAGTSTIVCNFSLSGTGSWTFAGGGLTYYNLQWQNPSVLYNQTMTMTGSNTFNNITIQSYVLFTRTLTLSSTTTQTVSSLSLTGASSTNQLVINAVTSGTAATFSVASGKVTGQYISLQDNTATGGATFYTGLGSSVVSNVTGWNYGNPSTTQNLSLMGVG
jgi:hypothetical protein